MIYDMLFSFTCAGRPARAISKMGIAFFSSVTPFGALYLGNTYIQIYLLAY
jgi:hypothetical protein